VTKRELLERLLEERILILDGAMGTMIQGYRLGEADFRGRAFADHPRDLKGCNDLLCLTKPEVVQEIHRRYLDAGADIIETNTFNATAISMADYALEPHVYAINKAAAEIAVRAAREAMSADPGRPRFVAGAMGPTNRTASLSPDVENPGFRAVSFDDLMLAYYEQARGLVDGGRGHPASRDDVRHAQPQGGAVRDREAQGGAEPRDPVMASLTITDASGRTLSGQTVSAAWISISHADLVSAGLNCALGAEEMRPHIESSRRSRRCGSRAIRTRGCRTRWAATIRRPRRWRRSWRVRASGLDQHRRRLLRHHRRAHRRDRGRGARAASAPASSRRPTRSTAGWIPHGAARFELHHDRRADQRHGIEALRAPRPRGDLDGGLSVARQQVEGGANILDVNMDEALLDSEKAMASFLNLVGSEPEIARLPIMVDSSKWSVIESGLKRIQGKGIVNSISLRKARTSSARRRASCAATGPRSSSWPSTSRARRRASSGASRSCRALTDPRRGDRLRARGHRLRSQHPDRRDRHGGARGLRAAFIEATRRLKALFPRVKVSGGVSNISFSFRGNDRVREAMHAAFLYHAIAAGWTWGS
jgi:5-methyltetrahydrofolate--homocysteine methyltransferase